MTITSIEGISTSLTSVSVVAAPYGAAGPTIAGTSKTGNDIGLGHKLFLMEEGHLGFSIGVRVRITALSEAGAWLEGLWLEGVVSYFANLMLEVESDRTTGTGNYSNWSITVAGEPGARGDPGSAGPPGPAGGAPVDNPIFTGNPRAPTPATADSDTSIATTAFVHAVTADYQPLDADLTSLAAASATGIIYYRSAADTWTPITIGPNITFTGGTLSASITGGGGGNVSNTGTPLNGQLARWINATTIEGVSAANTGLASLASPAFTGAPTAPTATAGNDSTQLATTAFVGGAISTRVVAPATNTAAFVPRWAGVNSKTLVDGLAVGATANCLVQLDGTGKLPAVDGSQLTGVGGAAAFGKQSIWIPATAMMARTTNGPASGSVEMTTNKNMLKTLDFDTAVQEFAQFDIRMPKSWDESVITWIPVWSHAATTTNFGVVWGLDAVAVSDNENADAGFGTEQVSVDTGGTTNNIYQGPESASVTIAAVPSPGDLIMFRIHRNPAHASDTMAIDARLHGVLVLYVNNVSHDT